MEAAVQACRFRAMPSNTLYVLLKAPKLLVLPARRLSAQRVFLLLRIHVVGYLRSQKRVRLLSLLSTHHAELLELAGRKAYKGILRRNFLSCLEIEQI